MKFELPSDEEIRYHGLMKVWYDQVSLLSEIRKDHPAFLEILSMKDKINLISLALWDLNDYCHNCFAILYTIVPPEKQPIVPENMKGRVDQIRQLWLEWGKKNGYLN